MELQATRHQIARFIETGSISHDVLDALLVGEYFCPAEGMLFDYKSEVPASAKAILKMLKHIAALHNTYGGYLIFGAKEISKDREIVPCQQSIEELDSKQVRDIVRANLSAPIELQCAKLPLTTAAGAFEIVLMHIPKRTTHEPTAFNKAAHDEKGNPIFQEGDVYFRDGDNSVPAQKPAHWRLIYGERRNPYGDQLIGLKLNQLLENNLPDRSVICSDFIGRQDTLEALWRWLSDDFSCVRVLAGEGGLGKTSIAYEFSEDICRAAPAGFEQVVWLSAKKQQFKGLSNGYERLPFPSFSSAKELFEQLYCHLGGLDTELESLNESNTPKKIRQLAGIIRSFIVIDDLDSMSLDEQKRAIEVCQQMAGSGSRFLFTTRKNTTASTASAIPIRGFDPLEFKSFVTSWIEKLALKDLNTNERTRLYSTTGGSPLYTESILRLLKSRMPFYEAIKEWNGKLGADVRLAALEREVKQLTHESRKVLAVAAIYRECAYTELKQATKYSVQTLNDCIDELQSLFLIHAPKIAQESRFIVSQTTRELVRSLGNTLIDNYQVFEENIKKIRYESSKAVKADSSSAVGGAILQAIAQLKDDRPNDALKTIDEVNSRFQGKNPDLLSMRGRVLLAMDPPRTEDARNMFRLAYDLGQRKETSFNLWFDAEIGHGSFDGAIDVCEKAISNEIGNKQDWYEMRAKVRIRSSRVQDAAGDREHAISQIKSAAIDVVEAIRLIRKRELSDPKELEAQELLMLVHDELWGLAKSDAKDVPSWVLAIDTQAEVIGRGDRRGESYERLAYALISMSNASLNNRTERTRRILNLIEQNIRRVIALFAQAPTSAQQSIAYKNAKNILIGLRTEYGF